MIVDDNQRDKNRLHEWLPKLARFQSLIAMDPKLFGDSEASVLDENKVVSSPDRPSTTYSTDTIVVSHAWPTDTNWERLVMPVSPSGIRPNDAAAADVAEDRQETGSYRQQIVHLPMDGIVSKMSKVNPFVLGLGCLGKRDPGLLEAIADELAMGCGAKSGRDSVLIRIRQKSQTGEGNVTANAKDSTPTPQSAIPQSPVRKLPVHIWHDFGESKMDKLQWNTQLLELLRLRKEFGLILIDLGDAESQAMVRLGRLCDGVVIQMMNHVNPRQAKSAIHHLKQEQLRLLGLLSLDCISGQ